MKHDEMLPLMGKMVTVRTELWRRLLSMGRKEWASRDCKPWSGWIVGFRYKLDGKVVYPKHNDEEGTTFHESSRQLCVMVQPWPTMNAVPIPLDGYELGGKPLAPDSGGWRHCKRERRS